MRRHVLSLLLLTGCGVGVEVEVEDARSETSTLSPSTPVVPENELIVHGLDAGDGTQVRWLLGYVSCGIMERGHGEATLLNGSFSIPHEPEALLKLYVFVDANGNGTCDEGVDSVREGDVVDRVVTLSPDSLGCWFADVIVRNP